MNKEHTEDTEQQEQQKKEEQEPALTEESAEILGSESGTEETVPESPTRIETIQEFTRAAWAWMKNQEALGCGLSPLLFFSIRDAGEIVEVLGRSLDVEEMQILVQKDGEQIECSFPDCGRRFQPVKYASVTRQLRASLEANGQNVLASVKDIRFGGSFFITPDNDIIALCGARFFYKQGKCWLSNSHQVLARNENIGPDGRPRWGLSKEDVLTIASNRKEAKVKRRDEHEKEKQAAKSLFAKRNFKNGPRFVDGK